MSQLTTQCWEDSMISVSVSIESKVIVSNGPSISMNASSIAWLSSRESSIRCTAPYCADSVDRPGANYIDSDGLGFTIHPEFIYHTILPMYLIENSLVARILPRF